MTNPLTTHLFGALLSDAEVADLFSAPSVLARMLAVEAAWTRGLEAVGEVSPVDAAAALAAIDGFQGLDLREGSLRDGVPVPALVAALRDGLPEAVARAIHTGATSQDILDSAMVLVLRDLLDLFEARLGQAVVALRDLETRFGAAPLMARTRMQAALPASASLRLDAWRRPLEDHLARLPAMRAELLMVQIGGPIGARDVSEEMVASVATSLGLGHGPVWHTDRSAMVSLGHWLSLVAGSLGKIGQDVALMAQQGVNEIALAGGGASSAMAHKSNPVTAETLVGLARYVGGQQGILTQALIHEQERSGAAWAVEWLCLPAMAEATGAALSGAVRMLANVERVGKA